jgi:AraC-like DNA-binding protein
VDEFVTRAPDPRLRPLLARGYGGFTSVVDGRGWLMPPTGTASLILNVGAAFGGLPDGFAAGLEETCSAVTAAGPVSCLDLKLTPLGAYTLLGRPMEELTGQVVDVAELFGAAGARLLEELRDAPDWGRRFAAVDGFLLRRAERGPEPAPAVRQAWLRIVRTGGRLPVGELAEEVGWSRRHLIARFRQQVGVPPKTLSRIVRFGALLRRLETPGRPGLAELATVAGYYDQAHLNRDFREFTGTTPTGYAARRQRGTEVTSVQDGSRPAA